MLPQTAQIFCSSMKLDDGHITRPKPCPIQSSPINSANMPIISKIGFIATTISNIVAVSAAR